MTIRLRNGAQTKSSIKLVIPWQVVCCISNHLFYFKYIHYLPDVCKEDLNGTCTFWIHFNRYRPHKGRSSLDISITFAEIQKPDYGI